jgi:transposase
MVVGKKERRREMGRGKPPAKAISMTALQKTLLGQEFRKRSTQKQFITRIELLLRAHEGQSNAQIARDLALTLPTVRTWRRRWENNYEQLCEYEEEMKEQGFREHNYLQVLLNLLRDLPRSGTRKQISLEQEQQIVALASEKPEDYGVEMTSWTHEILAKVAIARGIVEKVSSRHVGNILKKASFSRTSRNTGSSPESKTGKHLP